MMKLAIDISIHVFSWNSEASPEYTDLPFRVKLASLLFVGLFTMK